MKAAAALPFKRPTPVIGERCTPKTHVGEMFVRTEAAELTTASLHVDRGVWPVEPTRPFVPRDAPPVHVLLLGPPGSGKGTQAGLLTERLDIAPISTGNILRAELAQRTELGLSAQGFMQRGDLVPDSLMIDIIRERLRRRDCRGGFLLDGFPRTVPQARALDALARWIGIGFDRVIYLNVPEPELIRRITSRLTCSDCGRSYFFEPGQPRALSCEMDGMDLVVRDDDGAQTAQRRLAVYLQNTLPVLHHYREQGLVTEVDGSGSVEDISQRMLRALPVAATDYAAKLRGHLALDALIGRRVPRAPKVTSPVREQHAAGRVPATVKPDEDTERLQRPAKENRDA